MSEPVAYEFEGMTFCPSCAYRNTVIGLRLAGLKPGDGMDEAIATMMLHQIDNGLPVCTPEATYQPKPDACEACGKTFERQEAR